MKPFEEFWNTLTEDDFNALGDYVNNANSKIKDISLPENLLGNQIIMTATLSTKFILQKYHSWISEQL